MPRRNVFLVGGSLGCHDAVRDILRSLPAQFDGMVFLAVHRSEGHGVDYLPRALSRITSIPVIPVTGALRTKPGNIYVAPPIGHLIVDADSVWIDMKRGTSRTSIDSMFRSAAQVYGERNVGVILSGMLQDGSVGLWEVRKHGGVTITQDPDEAKESSMPQAAMKSVPVDFCLRGEQIGSLLVGLSSGTTSVQTAMRARIMIVEDDWLIATGLKQQLTDLGYLIVGLAPTGEDAMQQIEAARPDVVIMDVQLAGPTPGTEIAERMWKQYDVPIVYLTAHTDQATLADAQNSMPYAFLAKPQQPGHLHATLQMTLARRRRERDQSSGTA